jgi:hypothetical protein
MLRRSLTALLLVLPAAARAAAPEIVRVETGWRTAASFQRVSEYFGGKENDGGIRVLRTQPGARAGYYWLVRLKSDGVPPAGTKFELAVVTPAAPTPKTFTFPVAIAAGSALYDLGLTGTDWPDAKARPAAWRLRLLAADGRTLVAEQSFLWAEPPKP